MHSLHGTAEKGSFQCHCFPLNKKLYHCPVCNARLRKRLYPVKIVSKNKKKVILQENDGKKKSIDIKLNESSSYSQKYMFLFWRIRTYDMLVDINELRFE